MAKNSTEVYGALGKSNLLFFDPDSLKLVIDEASPLYDSRVHLPVKESLVRNIMVLGVHQPIIVAKNTETGETEVVVGRQRVKAAREANRRLEAQGYAKVQVPAVAKRSDGVTFASTIASENELREADTPLGRAEKMTRLLQLGRTEADLAVIFGCTSQTVKATLALLDCTAVVRTAVAAGKIGVGHAVKLSKMSADEQRETLAQLVAAGDGATPREKAQKQRAVIEPTVTKMRSRAVISAKLADSSDDVAIAVLRWVLGLDE